MGLKEGWNKKNLFISIGLILFITVLSFLPTLKNDFVNWDDPQYVTENRTLEYPSWENLKTIFTDFYMGHFHPLTLLTYLCEYQMFHLNPLPYHLTNLLIHLANSLLIFWLIRTIGCKDLTSFLVTLLFSIHPIHVEPVAWISERKDLLYSFFFLGSLISYLYYQKKGEPKYYYLSFILFSFSLLYRL